VSYKLSVESLTVASFDAGASSLPDSTHFRDCTSFPVCPRTDTTDAAAADALPARQPGVGLNTMEPGCTAFPELCPIGTHPTHG
jgi:hypothetical protein